MSKICHNFFSLELYCDQTVWLFQVFSIVLKRLCPLESKNTFVLVLANFFDFQKNYFFGKSLHKYTLNEYLLGGAISMKWKWCHLNLSSTCTTPAPVTRATLACTTRLFNPYLLLIRRYFYLSVIYSCTTFFSSAISSLFNWAEPSHERKIRKNVTFTIFSHLCHISSALDCATKKGCNVYSVTRRSRSDSRYWVLTHSLTNWVKALALT